MNSLNKQSIHTLEFGYRFEKMIDEIQRSSPDILALQEVDHLPMYLNALTDLGYEVQTSGREQDSQNYQSGLIGFRSQAILFCSTKVAV